MSWLSRKDLEDAELRNLSPWATRSIATGGRRFPGAPDPLRTALARDRDRVIHSTAFRRLQHKTQVFAAFEGDHFRSRMTHSLEVSQMARSVARALRLNADLAEAVALAHDLGHPPFGHVGELHLHQLMADHGGFRHNAQGARIVDVLEHRSTTGQGLNLTLVTRRSLLKGNVPDGFPLSEDLLPFTAADAVPLPVEAQLVDCCDKIAYVCHDLDDGLRANLFRPEEVRSLELWQRGEESLAEADSSVPSCSRHEGDRTHATISHCISLSLRDLMVTTSERLDATPVPPGTRGAAAETPSNQPKIEPSENAGRMTQEALKFLRARFYRADRVMEAMNRGSERIEERFAHYCRHPEELPERSRARLEQDGIDRTVCDYVSGMTDRYLLGDR